MFRRSTKLTALLVAAASVASMTPVMAAEKLNQRDGKINEAIAYDGGKYAYYGYRDDDSDTAIYYNNGSKTDKKMDDDLEDYEINFKNNNQVKYGTKYAYVTEEGNSDEYLVDLSTGKVVDDETAESKQDSAESKLISKLKKAERYNQNSDAEHKVDSNTTASNRLFKNQFGDVWYQYVVDVNATSSSQVENDHFINDKTEVTTGAAVSFGGNSDDAELFTGFYDESGKYIDASYIANMKIYNPRKNKATVIEKYGKIYNDEALKVDLIGVKPLAQDKDYIYTMSTVRVTYYKYDGNEYLTDGTGAVVTTQYFVQKISKAQGDKVDGAYVPKSVESFQIDYVTGVDYNGAEFAGEMFIGDGAKSESGDREFLNLLTATNVLYAVKDGDLYLTERSAADEIKTHRIKLGSDKVNLNRNEDKNNPPVANDLSDLGQALDLGVNCNYTNRTNNRSDLNMDGKSIDTKVAYRVNDDTVDYEEPEYVDRDTNTELGGVSIDTEGNTWVIYHGKIYMFDGSEFKVKYTTDRSYDRLDVYDKDSLIAWSQDTDSYTTIKEGKEQTVSDAKEIDSTLTSGAQGGATAKTGWEQQADGTWVLYDAVGNKVTGWANVSGVWYYMDAAGIMKTGWINDNGTWYYCNASGAMQTGWLNDNGTWYYLQSNGAMKTGWLNDNGTWYYLKSSGAMAANETIDGYYVNASGAWVK